MTPTPARRNQNCDDACRGVGMRCVASDFWFLNSCEALARRFPCENGCALVLGGVDVTGPHLYQIYPHGSTDKLPFTTMGSGSLAAMAVLETGYKENMTIEEGKKLVSEAISAGIFNDLGSGGNCDVCVITKDSKVHTRGYLQPNKRETSVTSLIPALFF